MENVLLVSGSQAVLRRRLVQQMVSANEGNGVRINYVDGSDKDSFRRALTGSIFFSGPSLAVVENPHKGDLDLYVAHRKVKKPNTMVLLHYEGDPKGNTKFGKWVKTLGSKAHRQFSAPSKWKAAEGAAAFAVEEAKSQHGKTLEHRLAAALVRLVGSDYGVLVFELRKMALLADKDGSRAIEAQHIKQGRAELIQGDVDPLLEALRTRNKRNLVKALHRLKDRASSDPTIWITRVLGYEVIKWLQATTLTDLPPKAAAEELGINAWMYEKKILPVARAWGKERIIHLIKALADSERGVFDGHISPWTGLCVNLLNTC